MPGADSGREGREGRGGPRTAARRLLAVGVVLCLLAAIPTAACAGAPPAHRPRLRRLAAARSFALPLGRDPGAPGEVARLAAYDVVVIDGEGAATATVRALRSRGCVVLAYLSVGTIEDYRGWYDDVAPYRLDLWGEWGEWYADTSAPGFRAVIADQVAPAILAKGFDGLFLDNVDMIETHPAQRDGMVELVGRLRRLLPRKRTYLFAQNGFGVMHLFAGKLDGWNREDVSWTFDFATGRYAPQPAGERDAALAELAAMRRRGLLVTATDYTDGTSPAATAACAAAARSAGALPFVSDIGLTRLPATPLTR